MQHILQVAFDFDDERVRGIVEKAIEQDLDTIIKGIILDNLAPEKYSYYGGKKDRNWEVFNDKAKERIDAILLEHKQDIIDLAANKLADSFKRTKAWKEKTQEVINADKS